MTRRQSILIFAFGALAGAGTVIWSLRRDAPVGERAALEELAPDAESSGEAPDAAAARQSEEASTARDERAAELWAIAGRIVEAGAEPPAGMSGVALVLTARRPGVEGGEELRLEQKSDAEGRFLFEGLSDGLEVDLHIVHPERAPRVLKLELPASADASKAKTRRIELRDVPLEKATTLKVMLEDWLKRPVEGGGGSQPPSSLGVACRLAPSFKACDAARALVARIAFVELSRAVLGRTLEPFPVTLLDRRAGETPAHPGRWPSWVRGRPARIREAS